MLLGIRGVMSTCTVGCMGVLLRLWNHVCSLPSYVPQRGYTSKILYHNYSNVDMEWSCVLHGVVHEEWYIGDVS